MVSIDDLTGIGKDKRDKIIKCLDRLISFKDSKGNVDSIITGYNFYNEIQPLDRAISLSNIHKSEKYKRDMKNDLLKAGYYPEMVLNGFRNKGGTYLWKPKFKIRNDDGTLREGLRIKDIKSGEYLDLSKFKIYVSEDKRFAKFDASLIAEDDGWEINIPFESEMELIKLTNLFLVKSYADSYTPNSELKDIKLDSNFQEGVWEDAWDTPILILGEKAAAYFNKLPNFDKATRMIFQLNNNEISFIIHNKYSILKDMKEYSHLINFGFNEEVCLGNKLFLNYIDKNE